MIAQLNKKYITSKPSKVFPRLLSYFLFEGRPATTKGRWFNPVTFFYLRKSSVAKHMSGCESPVFITGTGRSGSTILGLVLSMHPEIGFLNEPKALWFQVNSKDDLIGSYSENKALYIMNSDDADAKISASVKSIYSSFLKMTNSKRILDKFPEMIFRIEYLNKIFENPRYIFLYRNPWDTIASTALWSEKHSSSDKQEDWWGVKNRKWNLLLDQVIPQDPHLSKFSDTIAALTGQIDKAAVEWIVTMNYGIKMKNLFPEKILFVKYEDLAGDPEKTLKNICEFTGLEHNSEFISFGKSVLHTASGNKNYHINPVLKSAIDELCEKLGYNSHSPSMSVTE